MKQKLIHEDPMTSADFEAEWGLYQAASKERYEFKEGSGEERPKGDGTPQANENFRRLNLLEADVANVGGERCELGANERRRGIEGGEGTFMLYEEGKHYKTFLSMRLAPNYPIGAEAWQIGTQMKQAQPYAEDDLGGIPVLEMSIFFNELALNYVGSTKNGLEKTLAPAVTDRWVRLCWDVVYSADPAQGQIEVTVDDREGATDFVPQHSSGLLTDVQTLATAQKEGSGLAVGDPIPSHLRWGIYRNPIINVSTFADLTNTQVYEVVAVAGGSILVPVGDLPVPILGGHIR
jgi:hypothetical protein